MPFTPSHAVVALPFLRTPLVPAAIAIGAMAPDLPLFVRGLPLHYGLTHSLSWLPLTIVLALALLLVWRCVLRPAARELSPVGSRDGCPKRGMRAPADALRETFAIAGVPRAATLMARHRAADRLARDRHPEPHRVGPVHARGSMGRADRSAARRAVGAADGVQVAPARLDGARPGDPRDLGCAVAASTAARVRAGACCPMRCAGRGGSRCRSSSWSRGGSGWRCTDRSRPTGRPAPRVPGPPAGVRGVGRAHAGARRHDPGSARAARRHRSASAKLLRHQLAQTPAHAA